MDHQDRRGLVAAAIAVCLALVAVLVGVLIAGDGSSVDLAAPDRPERSTTTTPSGPPSSPAPSETTPPSAPPSSSQGSDETAPETTPPESTTPPTTTEGDVPLRPGEDVEVVAAASLQTVDWAPAHIYAALLKELGYQLEDPEERLDPAGEAYPRLADEEYDLWFNSRLVLEQTILDQPHGDGTIADLVSVVGSQLPAASRLGIAVDKASADELGVATIEELVEDPEASARFDRDGNGQADIVMCDRGPRCDELFSALESAGVADGLDLRTDDYIDAMLAVVGEQIAGDPVLFAHHQPFWASGTMILGDDIVWLSFADDSLPGEVDVPDTDCPAETCRLGVEVDDIAVAANQCFLDENPAARRLIELIELPELDVSVMHRAVTEERDPFGVSATWIDENRPTVEDWLAEARTYAANTDPQPCDGGGGATNPA